MARLKRRKKFQKRSGFNFVLISRRGREATSHRKRFTRGVGRGTRRGRIPAGLPRGQVRAGIRAIIVWQSPGHLMALPGMGYGRALLAENLLDPRENDAGRSKSGRKLLHPARLTAANRRYVTNGRRIIKETGRTSSLWQIWDTLLTPLPRRI